MFKIDRGNVEQTISLFFPPNTQIRDTESQKEPNPDLVRINFGELSLVYYKKDKHGFVYDKNRIYCGAFEKHDLKYLFTRIGQLLKAIKK